MAPHISLAHVFPPLSLVPCGNISRGQPPCTPCELWHLGDHVINFLLFVLAFPILTVALLVGGILWVTAGGSENQITKGKAVITSSIMGVLLAFGAWLIVDTIVKTLADSSQGAFLLAWNKFPDCPAPAIPSQPPQPPTGPQEPGPGITPPVTSTDKNRQQANLLINQGVLFSGSGDCSDASGNRVSAATNQNELIKGETITVCQSGCNATLLKACTKSSFTLGEKVLPALVLTRQNTNVNFTISSMATGSHSPTSDHYKGEAVDIVPTVPTAANYITLRNQLKALSGPANRVECEDNKGNKITDCGPKTTHLHATIR